MTASHATDFFFGSQYVQGCFQVSEASSLLESLTDGATYGAGTAVSMCTTTALC